MAGNKFFIYYFIEHKSEVDYNVGIAGALAVNSDIVKERYEASSSISY